MTWVFVLIAFTASSAPEERVLLDSPAQCMAYGQGYLSRPGSRSRTPCAIAKAIRARGRP